MNRRSGPTPSEISPPERLPALLGRINRYHAVLHLRATSERLDSALRDACFGRAAVVSAKADLTPAPPVDASVRLPRDLALGPRPERASDQARRRQPLRRKPAAFLSIGFIRA
jgi:hypothetical protein